MLSEEARQEIHARLAGTDAAPVEPVEQPKVEVDDQPEPKPREETAPQTTREVEPEKQATEKLVPISEVVKLRGERRSLKENLGKLEKELAELRGFVQGSKAKSKDNDQSWIDELETTEEPKTADELADIREFIAEQKREQGRQMLGQVIAAVKEAVPNIDEAFLIDELAAGRTPQQAAAKWQQYAARFAPPPPPAAPVKDITRNTQAPPTVPRAKTAGASSTKPTNWGGVSQAVRQHLASIK